MTEFIQPGHPPLPEVEDQSIPEYLPPVITKATDTYPLGIRQDADTTSAALKVMDLEVRLGTNSAINWYVTGPDAAAFEIVQTTPDTAELRIIQGYSLMPDLLFVVANVVDPADPLARDPNDSVSRQYTVLPVTPPTFSVKNRVPNMYASRPLPIRVADLVVGTTTAATVFWSTDNPEFAVSPPSGEPGASYTLRYIGPTVIGNKSVLVTINDPDTDPDPNDSKSVAFAVLADTPPTVTLSEPYPTEIPANSPGVKIGDLETTTGTSGQEPVLAIDNTTDFALVISATDKELWTTGSPLQHDDAKLVKVTATNAAGVGEFNYRMDVVGVGPTITLSYERTDPIEPDAAAASPLHLALVEIQPGTGAATLSLAGPNAADCELAVLADPNYRQLQIIEGVTPATGPFSVDVQAEDATIPGSLVIENYSNTVQAPAADPTIVLTNQVTAHNRDDDGDLPKKVATISVTNPDNVPITIALSDNVNYYTVGNKELWLASSAAAGDYLEAFPVTVTVNGVSPVNHTVTILWTAPNIQKFQGQDTTVESTQIDAWRVITLGVTPGTSGDYTLGVRATKNGSINADADFEIVPAEVDPPSPLFYWVMLKEGAVGQAGDTYDLFFDCYDPAMDPDILTRTHSISVVAGASVPPQVDLSSANTSIYEDQALPFRVSFVTVRPGTNPNPITTLTGTDAASFEIVAGELRIKAGVDLGAAAPLMEVTVNVHDPTTNPTPPPYDDFETHSVQISSGGASQDPVTTEAALLSRVAEDWTSPDGVVRPYYSSLDDNVRLQDFSRTGVARPLRKGAYIEHVANNTTMGGANPTRVTQGAITEFAISFWLRIPADNTSAFAICGEWTSEARLWLMTTRLTGNGLLQLGAKFSTDHVNEAAAHWIAIADNNYHSKSRLITKSGVSGAYGPYDLHVNNGEWRHVGMGLKCGGSPNSRQIYIWLDGEEYPYLKTVDGKFTSLNAASVTGAQAPFRMRNGDYQWKSLHVSDKVYTPRQIWDIAHGANPVEAVNVPGSNPTNAFWKAEEEVGDTIYNSYRVPGRALEDRSLTLSNASVQRQSDGHDKVSWSNSVGYELGAGGVILPRDEYAAITQGNSNKSVSGGPLTASGGAPVSPLLDNPCYRVNAGEVWGPFVPAPPTGPMTNGGTAEGTFDGSQITWDSDGTVFNLKFDDMTFPICEGDGSFAFTDVFASDGTYVFIPLAPASRWERQTKFDWMFEFGAYFDGSRMIPGDPLNPGFDVRGTAVNRPAGQLNEYQRLDFSCGQPEAPEVLQMAQSRGGDLVFDPQAAEQKFPLVARKVGSSFDRIMWIAPDLNPVRATMNIAEYVDGAEAASYQQFCDVYLTAGSNLNNAAQNNPQNTVFILGKGSHENQSVTPKTGQKFWGAGSILNGSANARCAMDGNYVQGGAAGTRNAFKGSKSIHAVEIANIDIHHYSANGTSQNNQDNVREGMIMLHDASITVAANSTSGGEQQMNGWAWNWVVRECELRQSGIVAIQMGNFTKVYNNIIHDNQRMGLAARFTTGGDVKFNAIYHNDLWNRCSGGNGQIDGGHGGEIKFYGNPESRIMFNTLGKADSNNNNACNVGMWWDNRDGANFAMENTVLRVRGAAGEAIFFEISQAQNDLSGFWGSSGWPNWETRYAHTTGLIARNNTVDYVLRLTPKNASCPVQGGNSWQGCGVTGKSSSDMTVTDNYVRGAMSGGVQHSHQGYRQSSVGMQRSKSGAEKWYDCYRNVYCFNAIVMISGLPATAPKLAGVYYNTGSYGQSPTQNLATFFANAAHAFIEFQDNTYTKEPGAPATRFNWNQNVNATKSTWQGSAGFDTGASIP